MSYLPLVSKCRCAFYLCLVVLVAGDFGSCASSNWRIVAQDNMPKELDVLSITFTDSYHGWALTAAQLLETQDGGETWVPRFENPDAEKTFNSLEFLSPLRGIIVGSRRGSGGRVTLILLTDDGGKSWRESPFSISSPDGKGPLRLHSVSFCNSQVGWAAGSNLIVHTTDGGQTWEIQRSGNDEVIFGVTCVSPKRMLAVGQGGLILLTTDGGKTWSRHDSGITESLARIRFFGGRGWVVGGLSNKGTLLRTQDDGVTWEPVRLNTSGALLDIYMSGQQGWIVGTNGTILHTDDGGQSWQQEVSPTKHNLTTIFFLNSQQGWIAGDKGTVLKLIN